ncbi:calcitonin receptor-like isoform X2 [Anneissia japonica]|uniref:calcitonin receptor-like isoform X2 n=1 Tax=Anneissia japonica TaxID=1529436 RepID=UPI00142557AD|nr:calcitonin receptor-like isoform X2 [Anneissia japonica]
MMWEKALLCVLVLLVAMTEEAEWTDREIKIQGQLLYLNFTPAWMGNIVFSDEQRKQLFEVAENCIELYLTIPKPIGDAEYCPFTFDGWKCWNYTKSGTTAVLNCPSYVPSSNKERFATKVCNEDGTWYDLNNRTWTNYSDCMAPLEGSIGYTNVYYVGYTLSVLSCCIALFIFCYFKSLACPRVTMHKNLFLAFVLHGVTYIIYNATIAGNSNVLARDSFDCRLMLMMWQYFQMCSYFWMLCEGIYLHRVVVVAVMSNQNAVWWYYVIGWALPILFIVVSALCKTFLYDKISASDNNVCWTNPSSLDWILAVPIIAVLVVNFLMLLNILRVLVSKLQHTHNSANSSYRRAARATLILVPLLGLHYIIMPMRIKNGVFYSYFMAVCLSIQGFFVACIFCFFNAEVNDALLRSYQYFLSTRFPHLA